MKNFTSLIIGLTLWCFSAILSAAPIDAPHNETNNIRCIDCHTYSTWWQYSPAATNTESYFQTVNSICTKCHGLSGPAPLMRHHNSTILGIAHGSWSQNCIDCHDPHNQAQLSWASTYASSLYLTTGTITTIDNGNGIFSYSYTDNGNGTSTIYIDPAATQSATGWSLPENWAQKNNNQTHSRGLIFVHSTTDAFNTYEIISASDTAISVQGVFNPSNANPQTDNSFGLIYGQLIRSSIKAATAANPNLKIDKPVTFFNPLLLNTLGGFTDQENSRQGICQVCHTKTIYWQEDGSNEGHNPTKTCTTCHLAENSFTKPDSHALADGTFTWDTACQSCHQPLGTEEIIEDIHQIGSTNTCTLCHQNLSGAPPLVGSAANASIGEKPHPCSECHIASTLTHHASAKAQAGDCTWCHLDPRPQWESTFGVSGGKPRQLACRECHVEPSGTGLTVYKLDYPVIPTDLMTFPDGNLSLAADNAKQVIKTVMDGSNGTVNHAINGPAKIDIYDFGACLSCHDGSNATQVNVWHARPKYVEIPVDTSSDAYRNHFDVLRYAPGRSLFSLWRGDGSQGEPYFSHPNEYYFTFGDAKIRGTNFYDSFNGRNSITWNWGTASDTFTLTAIPCFRSGALGNDVEGLCGENSSASFEMIPVFDNGPTRDQIHVNSAIFDQDTLHLSADNTNGSLSVTYDGFDYGSMTGVSGGTWTKSIPLTALTVNTVDIITSNPLGTSITATPVCLADPVSITSAEWDPSSSNTLTVLAENSRGPEAAMTISNYDGNDYPMTNTGGTTWQLIIPNASYQSQIELTGDCASTTAAVIDLTDQITITTAWWDPASSGNELTVWATNLRPGALVDVLFNNNTYAMTWNDNNSRYEAVISAPTYRPFLTVISNYAGSSTSTITSFGETISIAKAQLNNSLQDLSALAINQVGNTTNVYLDYNGSSHPLSFVADNRWELDLPGVSFSTPTARIWSEAGGYLEIIINECATPSWPPVSSGTMIDADSYWNRTEKNPDRLRVTVNVGPDGGIPKMLLNGTGTDHLFTCAAKTVPGTYRCQIEDNSLYLANYDHWIVIYTGNFPGDGSVLNYHINSWSVDQDPLLPSTIAGNGTQICTPLTWDSIISGAAYWDGNDCSIVAQNDWGSEIQLQAEYDAISYDLTWNNNQWSRDLTDVPYTDTFHLFSAAGADQFISVHNMVSSPDSITINDAGWNADGNGGLTITAINTYKDKVSLNAQYNGTSTPMTWNGSNWQLQDVTGISLPVDLTITSSAAAGGSAYLTPVEDRSPQLYPPPCGSNNNWDYVFTPLKRAEFDPLNNDELHIRAENLVNTSYGAELFMTYSETEDGQTHYQLTWYDTALFEYRGTGFTWSPGAQVSVWSQDSNSNLMSIECNQPVYNVALTDSITINSAEWEPATSTLTVMAQNTMGTGAQLYLDYGSIKATPFAWNDILSRWEATLNNTDFYDTVEVYSDANGLATAPVINLTPDPITILQALWRPDPAPGSIYVQAANADGEDNQLYVDLNDQTAIPMVWNSLKANWELDFQATSYPATVRVWSLRPGEATVAVTNMGAIHLTVSADAECAACHLEPDIIFSVHNANCSLCHYSTDPIVQAAISNRTGGSCTTCHIAASGKIWTQEIAFNYNGSWAIDLKDHHRPDSDILVPLPEYIYDVQNGPAAFPKDTPITIEVTFMADPSLTSAEVSSSLFAAQNILFTNGVSQPYYFTLPASFSQSVGTQSLTIDWQYCNENNSSTPDCQNPEPMHMTQHTLHITHAQPAGGAPYYAQLVQWSVNWAQDAINEQEIVDNIFDGIFLLGPQGYKYALPFLGRTGNDVGDVLRMKEGACGEWSAVMLRAVELHGVDVYYVDISPNDRDNYIVLNKALGTSEDVWLFGDHAFVIYGGNYIQGSTPNIGTVYDPVYHLTGQGWGGYEDVLIRYFEENDVWYPNPGFGNGPADDQVNSHTRIILDDWLYNESGN